MRNKYFIGWTDAGGAEIVDGPRKHSKNGYTVWKIKCPRCKNCLWTKPTFSRLKNGYICRSCFYEKNKIKNDKPSQNRAFNALKVSAKKRNLTVTISLQDFLEIASQDCYYCGESPSERAVNKYWQQKAILNGIDRWDNSLGYIKDNCRPCCTICNRSKNKYSVNEWKAWIQKVHSNFIEKDNNG